MLFFSTALKEATRGGLGTRLVNHVSLYSVSPPKGSTTPFPNLVFFDVVIGIFNLL